MNLGDKLEALKPNQLWVLASVTYPQATNLRLKTFG